MDSDTYSTKDLHIAAFLKLQGVQLTRLKRQKDKYKDRNPVYFFFVDKTRCEELIEVFWDDGDTEDSLVNVKKYVDTIRDLRNRISAVNAELDNKQE